MKRKSYLTYKPSGVPWLGDVPSHWEVKKLKYSTTINDETLPETTSLDYEFLYVDISNVDSVVGIIKKEPLSFEVAPSRARRIVREGDTIISTVRTYLRAIARINKYEANLIVSTGFAVIRPKYVRPQYLFYVLRAPHFIEEIVSRSVGVSYPAINASDIGLIEISLPPLPEQQAIADFLDRETGKIDTLINKNRRLIELLKEKRMALISRAVTKGLDPTVKMKSSGVEWLGDVPSHWEVKRFKHVVSIWGRIGFRGYTKDDLVDEGEGALALGASHITANGTLDLTEPVFISWEKYYESPEIMIKEDDLIVVQRGSCGRVGLVDRNIGPATINPSLVLLKNAKANPRFLLYVLLGGYVQSIIITFLSSTAVPMISQEQIGNFALMLPPLPEQQAIADFLDQETGKIDALINKVETVIEKLKEYRTALISAGVTGKIDVREAA